MSHEWRLTRPSPAVCDGLDSGRVMDALFGTGPLTIGGFEM